MDSTITDLPHISKIQFLDNAGKEIATPREWIPAKIELLAATEDWQEISLTCQGVQLPVYLQKLAGKTRILANWQRSNTGKYLLEFKFRGQVYTQSVTIEPEKISVEAFDTLLEDLDRILPVSIALGLERTGALAGVKFLPPRESTIAQELERLRRTVNGTVGRPGLVKVLQVLAKDHHQVLKSNELWVSLEKARRPQPANLAKALALPNNLAENKLPLQLLDTRVEHSADVYENRLVKHFYTQVYYRLLRLQRIYATKGYLKEVKSLIEMLTKARRAATFLDEVTLPGNLPTQLTMVLLKRPPYRAVLESYLEFNRSATVRLKEPRLDAPLENLPKLYQVWGTLVILDSLLKVATEAGYQTKSQSLLKKDSNGYFVQILPDGQPALILTHPTDKSEIRFIPERTYSRKSETFHSVSFKQRPDIAVELFRPGQPHEVYIFDPKYKLDSENIPDQKSPGRPKKEDIDKMHAYRDAIRDEENRQVVKYAAILYPGKTFKLCKEVQALRAYPGDEELEKSATEIFRGILRGKGTLL